MGQHIEAMSCPDCRNIVPLVVGGVNSFLNLFFNPCHQYRYCILLFFSCQLSSGRYMMPFEETSTTAAACSMLGYKYRMTSHRRLFAVIGYYGRSKAFGNEILRMLTDGCQTLFCNIFLIPPIPIFSRKDMAIF